jgi:hypothetical protein
MRDSRCRWWFTVLVGLLAAGCAERNTTLTAANFRAKFDEVEAAYRERPGRLMRADVEGILGPGETVAADDPELATLPPVADAALAWTRWPLAEVLLVGYAPDGRAATVVRVKR